MRRGLAAWGRNVTTRWLVASFLAATPILLFCVALLSGWLQVDAYAWLLFAGSLLFMLISLILIMGRASRPFDTLANLVSALRARDYSVRVATVGNDAFGGLVLEINRLADDLYRERLSGQEGAALLEDVLAALDIAVIAFDSERRIRVCNAAAAKLVQRSASVLLGQTATDAGIESVLNLPPGMVDNVFPGEFPGTTGRWEIRHSRFRRDGRPLELRLITDLSRPLRDQEREAWRRLIRVLAHEINNSLAPITALADTVHSALLEHVPDGEWRSDALEAAQIIGGRAQGLNRFLQRYSQLARLPPAVCKVVDVHALLSGLLTMHRFVLDASALADQAHGSTYAWCDPDQIAQVLLNLLRNAEEAGGEVGAITARIETSSDHVLVEISDEGSGLPASENLFVPFFTTKPGGSGIGLVLSRQIAESQGGSLELRNRTDRTGAQVRLLLPRAPVSAPISPAESSLGLAHAE